MNHMNHHPLDTLTRIAYFIALVALLARAPAAQAQFAGTSSAVFQNPVGPPGMVVLCIGTNWVYFGDPGNNVTPFSQSSLFFWGPPFAASAEASFPLGTLTFLNGTPAVPGTEMDQVDMHLRLSFTSPSSFTADFNYPITVTSTPNNSGTRAGDADYVTLPSFSSTVFTEGGKTYTLEIQFGDFTGDGFLVGNQLHVYEDAWVWAPIIGKITETIPPRAVPDGGSTLLLLGVASTLLVTLRRK